ncbi:uncharacterized protein LOC105834504 isoform X2 [Monomorium pharaonis]|uniref:uncharacterized protein LOC105834504 isoform X2 n=1 Tax=Monomorium pharaonis TaxID=307658 RepID=UPI00063F0432|nr:uncharacterized protein LOC105834504 isoform X2 [Monomorium pharaonis]
MLSSKANAALARLKEIEEKYKLKRKEQKWKEDADSSISSVSIVSLENFLTKSKESPTKVAKPKLDIKMPDTRFEGDTEESKLSSGSEKTTPSKTSVNSAKDATDVDLDAAIPLDDKSSRSVGKQESLISGTMTILETSLVESVLDDSMTPSKLLSYSKTLQRNSFTISDRSSGHEDRRKMAMRSAGSRESGKSSEISRGKAQSDNSSIAEQLRFSRKSNEKISRMHLDQKKCDQIEDKATMEKLKEEDSKIRDHSNDMGSSRDDSIVEESIDTMENGSEIISELSHAEKNSTAKIEDYKGSKDLTHENISIIISNSSKGLMTENGYVNDTFEDISSSTIRSQWEEMINEKNEVVDGVKSRVKKINISEYGSYQDNAKKHRDGSIIALNVTPKLSLIKIDSGSSNYVSESIITNLNDVTVHSMKLCQSFDSRNQKRHYQHRKALFRNENVSNVVNFNKNTSDSSESSTDDVTKMNEKKKSSGMTTVRQESGRNEYGGASNRARERAVIDVTELPVANDKNWIESVKSNLSLEDNGKKRQEVSEKSLNQEISQDVEYILRKSHKNLAKKHTNSKTATEVSESSYDNKTVFELHNALKTRKVTRREENESCRCSKEKNKVSNYNCHKHNTKRKKKGVRTTNSKSIETRNGKESCKEDKALNFNGKQTRGLQKRIVELRLQEEREDLQKYLHKLKDLRLESGSTRSYFKPLEFPKLAEFTQPDLNNLESKPNDQYRERVLAIRRWLKDQYVLYRDYCTMAQAINAHYVPTTLDDAKKTIRELRKTTIKTR